MTPAPEKKATKILVVDDNEASLLLARSTLEDEGYTVLLATDGPEGVALFLMEQPDCVLLDVRMPGTDGFAVCERIRALPHGADVPVLFLTALRDVDTFDRALRAGGDDFLTKPVRPTEMVIRVESALKLRRLNEELRDQYDVLKEQRDRMLRLQLQKERLSAFVIHDLKNPVSSMDLHAQVLLRDPGLSPSARDSAAQIRTEARHLHRMILNLLDVAKADEGQLVPKPRAVELEPLLAEIFAELAVGAEQRQVALESTRPIPAAYADVDLLRRTLTNLLENAIRYAPPKTAVSVAAERTAEGVVIRVADAGPGVPIAWREKVFDAFAQVESPDPSGETPARGSRGLGLTFCRVTAQAHGGRIWVEDGAPGAIFCISVPHAP